MGYHNKREGDRLNKERAAAFNAGRPLYCPFCRMAGQGMHMLMLSEDERLLFCPQCRDSRPATDEDRRVYGGAS
jgi:hypothetical protein